VLALPSDAAPLLPVFHYHIQKYNDDDVSNKKYVLWNAVSVPLLHFTQDCLSNITDQELMSAGYATEASLRDVNGMTSRLRRYGCNNDASLTQGLNSILFRG